MEHHVVLKVLSPKGSVRFGQKGQLSLRFIEPFEILQRVVPVAYRLALPHLYRVFTMFSISSICADMFQTQAMSFNMSLYN